MRQSYRRCAVAPLVSNRGHPAASFAVSSEAVDWVGEAWQEAPESVRGLEIEGGSRASSAAGTGSARDSARVRLWKAALPDCDRDAGEDAVHERRARVVGGFGCALEDEA